MSGNSGAYPQKMKRKRRSTESGVMDRDLLMGSVGPMAQEGGEYDDDSSEEAYVISCTPSGRSSRETGRSSSASNSTAQ